MPRKLDLIALTIPTQRNRGFWIAGATALFLSCVSWLNLFIVRFFNDALFHSEGLSSKGWSLYVALRFLITLFLLWTVLRFPRTEGQAEKGAEGSKDARFFDPLMGLRALACVLVLMGHYFMVVFPFTPDGVHTWVRVLLIPPPWSGVWIFFSLSGFLMGKGFARARYTLDEIGFRLFLRNRMLRIAPIYYTSVLFVSIYRYPEIFQLRNLWMFFELCLFDYRGDLPISPNQALWSISTEVQFYLLVPLLMIALVMLKRWLGRAFIILPFLLLCLGTAARMQMATHGNQEIFRYGYSPLLGNLDLFLAGMSINLFPLPNRGSIRLQPWLDAFLMAAGLGFYPVICYVLFHVHQLHMENFLAKGPAFCVLFSMAFIYLAEIRGRILIMKGIQGGLLWLIQGIGTLTYCLYVFHPDIMMANARILPSIHDLRVSLACFPLVVFEIFTVAYLVYATVEKPFDLKKRVSGTALVDAP